MVVGLDISTPRTVEANCFHFFLAPARHLRAHSPMTRRFTSCGDFPKYFDRKSKVGLTYKIFLEKGANQGSCASFNQMLQSTVLIPLFRNLAGFRCEDNFSKNRALHMPLIQPRPSDFFIALLFHFQPTRMTKSLMGLFFTLFMFWSFNRTMVDANFNRKQESLKSATLEEIKQKLERPNDYEKLQLHIDFSKGNVIFGI